MEHLISAPKPLVNRILPLSDAPRKSPSIFSDPGVWSCVGGGVDEKRAVRERGKGTNGGAAPETGICSGLERVRSKLRRSKLPGRSEEL
jgi:hypothetical protein